MSKKGLGGGEIAGIVIGSVAAAIIVFGGIFAWDSGSSSGSGGSGPEASTDSSDGRTRGQQYEFVDVPDYVTDADNLSRELRERLRLMANAHKYDDTNIDGLLKYAAEYAGFLAKCNHEKGHTLVRAMVIQLYALVIHRADELKREGVAGKRGIEVTDILTKVESDIGSNILPTYCEGGGSGCWHHRAH